MVLKSWPIAYETKKWPEFGPGNFLFVYYIGYYVVAAVIGKCLGWTAANLALWAWTVVGVWLAVALLLCTCEKRSVGAAVLVMGTLVLFGGLDIVGFVVRSGIPSLGTHIEWWNRPWFQYSSLTTQLVWVPQHAVAAWVATSLLLLAYYRGVGLRRLAFIVAAALLFTPFAVVGLVPFAGLTLADVARKKQWAAVFSTENLVGSCVVGIPAGLFLTANSFSFPIEFLPRVGGFWMAWLSFVCLEVLVFVPWIRRELRAVGWVAIATLLVIPIVRIGQYNDFAMRASIPALWILAVCTVRSLMPLLPTDPLRRWEVPKGTDAVFVGVLLLAALTPVQELFRSLIRFQVGRTWDVARIEDAIGPGSDPLRLQQKGDADSLFFRSMTRPPRP
jgi:hypothetical protein